MHASLGRAGITAECFHFLIVCLLCVGLSAAELGLSTPQLQGTRQLAFSSWIPKTGVVNFASLSSFCSSSAEKGSFAAKPFHAMSPVLRGQGRRRGALTDLRANQNRENKRRRMLRIAELRREMVADVQRLRQRVKEKLERKTSTLSRDDPVSVDDNEPKHIKGSFSKEEVTEEMKRKTERNPEKSRRTGGTINKVRDAERALGPLLKERRTAYERRRRSGPSANAMDDSKRKQWGPKQMVYCPPDIKFAEDFNARQQRIQQTRRLNQIMLNATGRDGENTTGSEDVEAHEVMTDNLFICRHADRFNPDWSMRMESFSSDHRIPKMLGKDFPLSELGHRQAWDLGEYLASQGVTTVVSSPYLRCIQTAQYVAWATGTQILVEPGLAEGPGHEVGWLPDLIERYRYFPDIDPMYEPLSEEPSAEIDDMMVIPRSAKVAKQLAPKLLSLARAGGVAVITHASVAIALTAWLAVKGGKISLPLEGDWVESVPGDSDSDASVVGRGEGRGAGVASFDSTLSPLDHEELKRTLDSIDSARPAGAYKLTWSNERQKWETSLGCLTHYLLEDPGTGPRTPAWRFTFPTAEK